MMAEFYRSRLLETFPDCLHAVTTKDKELLYEGSLALHTGEVAKEIVSNRQDLIQSLELSEHYHFVTAHQTHSDNIVMINKQSSKGWDTLEDAIEDCDAMITDQKGVVLTVLTADCVPVLLYDSHQEVIAAIHAGWKGSRANITGKTVQKMIKSYGSDPKDIIAFIAPSIGRCCYEVGEDVASHFSDPEIYDTHDSKYMLDLPLINQKQLLDEGVMFNNIELSNQCTSCEVDTYFSYRKEKGCSGRFMSMIGLRKQ